MVSHKAPSLSPLLFVPFMNYYTWLFFNLFIVIVIGAFHYNMLIDQLHTVKYITTRERTSTYDPDNLR